MEERVQKAMFDYFRLEGQAAIVTGSGNGIGRATAIMLADLGARVMVCDIEGDSAKKVAEEIGGRGGTALYNRCDVTNLEEIRDTIGKTAEAFGGVDILVNNAAGFGGGKTFDRMTYEEWDRLIRINLTGAYMFTNEVLPYMVKKQHGKICMVSSGAALGYDFSDPHYAASKAGMIGHPHGPSAGAFLGGRDKGPALAPCGDARGPGGGYRVFGVRGGGVYYRTGALSQRRGMDVGLGSRAAVRPAAFPAGCGYGAREVKASAVPEEGLILGKETGAFYGI